MSDEEASLVGDDLENEIDHDLWSDTEFFDDKRASFFEPPVENYRFIY